MNDTNINDEVSDQATDLEIEKKNFSHARFRNHFDIPKKLYHLIIREQFSKIKIAGLFFSLLAIVGLIWLAITDSEYTLYLIFLTLIPLGLMTYIILTIYLFIRKIDPRIKDDKNKINYDIYFFKSTMVVRTYICEDKFKVKMRPFVKGSLLEEEEVPEESNPMCQLVQETINYKEVIRIIEAKRFIYIITKNRIYFFNKAEKFKKRRDDTIDTFRKYLQEKANLYIYITTYSPGRLYESYYEIDYQLTLQENTSYLLICLSIFAALSPICLNLIPEMKYQYVWLFWLGGALCLIDLLAILFMHYKKSSTTWRFYTIISISIVGIIATFVFGISGSIINSNIAATEDLNNVIEQMDIEIPNQSSLNSNIQLSKDIDDQTFYRNELIQTFTNDEEISSFEATIANSETIWETQYSDDNLDLIPDDLDSTVGDYHLFYDEIRETINPTYAQAENNSIIWYLIYNSNKDMMYSYNYNIIDGVMY
jgi:hypothetical protein